MTADPQKPAQKPATQGNWADLRTRVLSGVVLALLGLGLLLSQGVMLRVGLAVLVGLLVWELARLTGHLDQPEKNGRHALLTGLMAGFAQLGIGVVTMPEVPSMEILGYGLPLLALVPGLIGATPRNRWPFALFLLAIFGAALGILLMREMGGLWAVLWIAGIVVTSDILGYFAGRTFGGPKFWPAISPKKTWSGTVAGWIGAFVFTLILQLVTGNHNLFVLVLAPVVSFSGQMGDIAESWLKRRVGVKDSSNLIPGHGGVLDRFDALIGAFLSTVLFYLLLTASVLLFGFPATGG